ncbi:hypothetical protein [Micromonospora sp. NPDC004704]
MTDYQDYLRALSDLVQAGPRGAEQARLRDERFDVSVDRARGDAETALARNRRLRQEVSRQLETVRTALTGVGRADLLPLPTVSARVAAADAEDVTEAVRTLQLAVAELEAVIRDVPAGGGVDDVPRGRRRTGPVVAGLLVAVLMVALFMAAFSIGRN